MKLSIVYEDPELLILDKPYGLVTMGAKGEHSLYAVAQKYFKKGMLYVVHRLDKDTSGLVIFAKDRFTHKTLFDMFQKRKIKKRYHALVPHGVDSLFDQKNWKESDRPYLKLQGKKTLEITLPIFGIKNKSRVDFNKGNSAHTLITIKEKMAQGTLLDIEPKTGRFHQIRCHLSYLGYSVQGDTIYQGEASSRLMLNSYYLSFYWKNKMKEIKISTKLIN
ncbi:MAG: RluA family pseudouridine synthase [Bacteriovoracaceae bacterium]|nr:RluA family pseudouridine synthase [Bacteriovoracaceae bacterium]